MKKIITVLFAVFAMTSMFAYIPNKKNVEKYGDCIVYGYEYKNINDNKDTSYITYNTKTGEIYFKHYKQIEYIKKTYSPDLQKKLITTTEKMWEHTDNERKNYRIFTDSAEHCKKRCKEYCKEDCKENPRCEDSAKEAISIAKEIEKQFLDDYPFFTEENWQTLTKEEWNEMAKDFLENN